MEQEPRIVFPGNLLELMRALVRHDVKFLVTGARAGNFYGLRRGTSDLDLVYDCTPDNVQRLTRALADLHISAPPDLGRFGVLFSLKPLHFDADLLSVRDDGEFEFLELGAITTNAWNLDFRIIGKRDLVIHKRQAAEAFQKNADKQRADAEELEDLPPFKSQPPRLVRGDRRDNLLRGKYGTGVVRNVNVEGGTHNLIGVICRRVSNHRDVVAQFGGIAHGRFDAGMRDETDDDQLVDAVLLEL